MDQSLEIWQRNFVVDSYNKGMRSCNLGDQPSPWMLRGLQILESGETLTVDKIKEINQSGGTDHPDPTF